MVDFPFPAEAEAFRDELRVPAGGIGFTWEHDAHLYRKRLLSWSAFLVGPHRYLREIGSQPARTAHTPRSTP